MLDCQLFGLNPGMHHLSSLITHIANTLLLFLVLKLFTNALWKSAFVAALFALHPVNVDSVAWISERKNVLSTFFWLLTMLSYFYYTKRPGIYRYMLTLTAFTLGLLTKPMLVTLPCVLLLMDYWPLRRIRFSETKSFYRPVFEKIPVFFLSGVITYLSSRSLESYGNFITTEFVPIKLRIANAVVSYVNYTCKMVLPINLSIYYPYPSTIPVWKVVSACLFLIIVSLFVIRAFKQKPYLAVGWLWFLGTLVPVIGFVQAGLWPKMADRWAYVPFIGLYIMFVWGTSDLVLQLRSNKLVVPVGSAMIILLLSAVTWMQTEYWENSYTIFEHALKVTENNALAHNNMGNIMAKQGKMPEAVDHYSEALRIDPYSADTHNNMGYALMSEGNLDKAIAHYLKALHIDPDCVEAHNNLGAVLINKMRFNEAIIHLNEAIRINPEYQNAHENLRKALDNKKKIDEATAPIHKALESDPENHILYFKLGNIYKRIGKLDEAIKQYNKSLFIQPNGTSAMNNLGQVYIIQQKYDEAFLLFKKIIELQPESIMAHYNMACIYAKQNKVEKSIEWLKKAVEAGFRDWDLIKSDNDLENIRETDYYRELIKER
jgi:tetratricopeptide (TPR) repeat protein